MKKNKIDNSANSEILSKGKKAVEDFDSSKEIFVKPHTTENKLISIRLPMAMIRALRMVARTKGDIGYQQVVKTYIAEGLIRDQQRTVSSQYVLAGASLYSSTSVSEDISSEYKSEGCATNIS